MNHDQLLELINNHASVRSFKTDPVPEDVLEKILLSASRASSSGNMQAYSIIVTRDQKMKEKLFKAHFEQEMLLEAPIFLTFCADFNRMRKWLEVSEAPENFDNYMSFMIGAIDAILASQNAALAAEAQGLGICYMGTTLASTHEIADILKCPDNVVPVAGFVLGYPNERPLKRDRLSLSSIVHNETYRDYSNEDVIAIYAEKEKAGMKRYMENPELKKMIEEMNIKNLAQVYTKAKYTRESHLGYSQNVLNCLKERNFFKD